MPSTPSYLGRGKRPTIWLPKMAVAPRSGDEGGGAQPSPLIGPVLVERQANQSLDPGEIDAARLVRVFRVQREGLGLCRHGTPCWGGGSLHHRVGSIVMVGDQVL